MRMTEASEKAGLKFNIQNTKIMAAGPIILGQTDGEKVKPGFGWSPCCPRDSQESSSAPQFKSINSLVLSLLQGTPVTSIHYYWKNNGFDYAHFCQQKVNMNSISYLKYILKNFKCSL